MMRSYGTLSAHQRPTVGDTKTSVVGYDHLGWMKCDGRELTVAEYYSLFRVIGYSFGGSDISFNLPDAAGRVAGMVGTGPASTSWALGDVSGAYTHTLTIPQMPIHTHTGTTDVSGTHDHGGATNAGGNQTESETVMIGGGANVSGSGTHTHTIDPDGAHTHTFTTNSTGGSLPHNNMQPTIFMGNMFIYAGKPEYGAWPFQAGLAPPML